MKHLDTWVHHQVRVDEVHVVRPVVSPETRLRILCVCYLVRCRCQRVQELLRAIRARGDEVSSSTIRRVRQVCSA